MAQIIGYNKVLSKKYKGHCPKCGAIIVFDEDELHDKYQENYPNFQHKDHHYSEGTCPGCGFSDVRVNKNKDEYMDEEKLEENLFSLLHGWPHSSNCKRNCAKCDNRCLYRKEQRSEQ